MVPVPSSRTAQGSMLPSRSPASAMAMYAGTSCTVGTEVNHSSHSRPSDAAAASASPCPGTSGSSRTPCPSRVTRCNAIMTGLQLPVMRHAARNVDLHAHTRCDKSAFRVSSPRCMSAASHELNPAQHAAVTHGDGPLLIIAGAGTGKTRTLVHRVVHLIDRGVAPQRILLLTFTRRAAQEMLRRVEALTGSRGARVHGGTFHATAHRLLRSYGAQAGLAPAFTTRDQGDAIDLGGISRAELGFGQRKSRFPRKETLHHVYSRHVNTEIAVGDILRDEFPQFEEHAADINRVFADYTARKERRNLVDYDDLLLFWAAMLDAPGDLGTRIAALYDHVLVDEYQDTNLLQARILRGLCRSHRNITVVGDDAQSIYSFRGATVRNILAFP